VRYARENEKKHRKSQINSKKRKSTAGKEVKTRGYKGDIRI
jgi:hypothetical protein